MTIPSPQSLHEAGISNSREKMAEGLQCMGGSQEVGDSTFLEVVPQGSRQRRHMIAGTKQRRNALARPGLFGTQECKYVDGTLHDTYKGTHVTLFQGSCCLPKYWIDATM